MYIYNGIVYNAYYTNLLQITHVLWWVYVIVSLYTEKTLIL